MIIDTHQHLWDLDRVAYPWLVPEFGPIARTFVPADLEPQLGPAGVTHTVLVQAANSYADTEYMFEQAALHSYVAGVVGWVPLLYPDVAGRAIERFSANPKFVGMRHLIHNEADSHWLLQDRVIEGLKLLAQHNLTFDVVATTHEHLECIPAVSERVPDLRMVIDHLGQPPIQSGTLGQWGEDVRIAAQNPNVFAKISGLGHRQWHARQLERGGHTPVPGLRPRHLRAGTLHDRRRLAGVRARRRIREGLGRVSTGLCGVWGGRTGATSVRDGHLVLWIEGLRCVS